MALKPEDLMIEFEAIYNSCPDRDDYHQDNEWYLDACYSNDAACTRVRDAMAEIGYYPEFIRMDDTGWYHFDLRPLVSE